MNNRYSNNVNLDNSTVNLLDESKITPSSINRNRNMQIQLPPQQKNMGDNKLTSYSTRLVDDATCDSQNKLMDSLIRNSLYFSHHFQ